MRKFFKTVLVVTIFSTCEKFLGFLYRIYLSRSIGAEGVGIYQVALSVFALLLTVCSSGTPVTVSRLMTKYTAENRTDKKNAVITAGIVFSVLVAIPICMICFAFKGKLSTLFANEHSAKIFFVVVPSLIFTSVYSVLRGVFWGNKDFLPYSVIELLEEICMILLGIVLISRASDIYDGAVRAGIAVALSYVFSFSLAMAVFILRKNKLKSPKHQFRPLLASAMPITAMRTAGSLVSSLVSVVLPLRLISAGLSKGQALSAFGATAGQAMPLLSIPTTFIGSFILVLIPEISENFYKHNTKLLARDVEKALKITCLITCVFVPVFTVCGEEIGLLVFNSHECGKFLGVSAFLMLFMSLSAITTSILNSIGLEHKTLFSFVISGGLMLVSVWVLPAVLGIYALLVGYACIYVLTTLFNLVLIKKHCKLKLGYLKFSVYSALLTIPTILFGAMLEKLLLKLLGTLLCFFACSMLTVVFYLALAIGFNIFSLDTILHKKSVIAKSSVTV